MTPDAAGAWTLRDRRPGPTRWRPGSTTPAIKIPAGVDVELMFTEGRLLLERVASRPAPQRRAARARWSGRRIEAATDSTRPDRGPARGPAGPRACSGVLAGPPAARAGHRRGPLPGVRRPARARSSAAGTSSSRAPRARPATRATGKVASGTFRTAAERLDAVAAMGFDVIYLPPIHPIGEVNRKGPNNTLTPGPDDPGSPVGDRLQGRRPRRDPPRPGHLRGLRRLRRAGPRARASRSRSTSPCRPRPTTRGSPSTPSGSPPAPTAPSPTRRTRRRSTRTSTRSTSTTTPRASAARCCASSGSGCRTACGSSASTTRTPSRWRSGSGCSARSARTDPDVLFLAEAFTRPRDDARARRGRLPPVLHLLHLAQRQVGDRGVPRASSPPRPTT